jgi:glyceraldehyde 3-phosphate dehydrogenase
MEKREPTTAFLSKNNLISEKMVRLAINGFGRIGRLAFRVGMMHPDIEIVGINDLQEPEYLAYLLKYDSMHGRFPFEIKVDGRNLIVNGQKIHVSSEKSIDQLPWKALNVDVVLECTGIFLTTDLASEHLKAGAKKVVLSAPAKDDTPTFVMGVNDQQLDSSLKIVSNASCTTNCLAPLAKVLNDHFEIEEGLMTTVHAVTATQKTVDGPSAKDWRGGRGAYQNIIPSSTGAAKAVSLVIPELKNKLTGMSFRVPVANVSVVDLTVKLKKSTNYENLCNAIRSASETSLKGVIEYTDEDVVSTDFIGNPHTCIFDAKAGISLNDNFFKLIAWYDNEWGYSNKLIDLAYKLGTI